MTNINTVIPEQVYAIHPLAKPVLDQLNGDFQEKINQLVDVTNGGADGGFGGFIYYNETYEFYKANQKAIAASVVEYAEDTGVSPIEFVQGFRCLQHNKPDALLVAAVLTNGECNEDDRINIANALAWYALELVAGKFADFLDE